MVTVADVTITKNKWSKRLTQYENLQINKGIGEFYPLILYYERNEKNDTKFYKYNNTFNSKYR